MLKRLVVLSLLLGGCASAPELQRTDPFPDVTSLDVAALNDLMRLEDTRTFDTTAFNLLSTSSAPFIRTRAMLAMGRIGDRAAVPLLLRGLGEAHDSVRTYAAFALGELGDSSAAVVQALGLVSGGKGAPAQEAIHALGKIGGSAARPYVEAVLRQRKDGPELQEALLAIWRFPRQPSTSAVVKPHVNSSDPEVRWRAVYALVRGASDPVNVRDFHRWVTDRDPRVRALAVRGLRAATVDSAQMRAPSIILLLGALGDADPHVRINAVSVLAGYRDSAQTERPARLLHDADANVRMAAAQALGVMRGALAARALEATVRDMQEHVAVRGAALGSLALADPAHGLAVASEFARSQDPVLRVYAARALGNVRSAEAVTLLRTMSNDTSLRVQIAAVSAVAAIAGDTLQPARAFFMEKLASREPWVRAEALAGLERLVQPGDEAIVMEALEFALQDRVEDAANAAIAVLAKLVQQNPAIRHSFTSRFPLSRMPLRETRKTAIQAMKLTETCCQIAPRPEVYDRIVRNVFVPYVRGNFPVARVTTAAGSFDIELLPLDAPMTVDNFMSLVRSKYFDGGRWHRVVPNFVLQDGDPTGTGNGGPGYAIRDEINRVRYLRGAVGMALSGPDTGGSQWFITHSPQPHLDGGYTVFGRVINGMDIADAVVQEDPIVRIEMIR